MANITAQVSGQQASPDVAIRETLPAVDRSRVKKLIVAVHGVGDQYSYATLQAVVGQFCRFHGQPAGVPLGAFHTGDPPFPVQRESLEGLAFAEVYWAAIPREVVADMHTLEEAKKWAATIVERLKLRWHQAKKPAMCLESDFAQSTQILHEMIETIAVADRLCYLADKAGVFTFDLRRVLDDYLGDVQIVTEFGDERGKILEAFRETLAKAVANCPSGTEVYIVSHSEGTVVSLLGLLAAFRSTPVPEWALQVRGLMTLGSPIDKHLFFWPELFANLPPAGAPARPIAWRNYYDYGDPIGFELNEVRQWMADVPAKGAGPTWRDVFAFEDDHDIGFTRYPFPGKAHVDYWTDDDVFGHFIRTVVDAPPLPAADMPPAAGGTTKAASAVVIDDGRPRTKPASWVVSWVAPYVAVMALLFVGAYVLYKAVTTAIDPDPAHHRSLAIAKDVSWLALLLFGVTIAARVPRLTRLLRWRLAAFAVALVCTLGYVRSWHDVVSLTDPATWEVGGNLNVVLGLAVLVIAGLFGAVKPQWGAKPMIALGAAAVAITLARVLGDAANRGPAWPVFIAAAAFLYLWWLAALLFDLIVVWHLYIRTSRVNTQIRAMTRSYDQAARAKPGWPHRTTDAA